jgi:hypothetical protein
MIRISGADRKQSSLLMCGAGGIPLRRPEAAVRVDAPFRIGNALQHAKLEDAACRRAEFLPGLI